MSLRLGVRGRLLTAFVLVAVPPLLLLALAVAVLLSRSFESATRQRLDEALRSARQEMDRRLQRAQAQVDAVVREDLAEVPEPGPEDRALAETVGRARDLDVLEILDAEGRVISSRHWPAGFGLPDRDRVFPGQDAFRLETVAEGHGAAERLVLVGMRSGLWRGQPVLVRGGSFLDIEFTAGLSALMGLDLGLRDQLRSRWIAAEDSPFEGWNDPPLEQPGAEPEVALRGESYRWRAARLHSGLWLVAAMRRGALDALTANVRRLTGFLTAAVLLAALAAALVLSGRIARPVRELALGAHRVASGDLAARVPVAGTDEIGELARSFNAMTDELRDSRERLLQAERVAAWREMARRLAHELKNPLFPIQLSIETLQRVLDLEQKEEDGGDRGRFAALFRESSQTILDELRSLRKIIDEFSDFARMPRPQLRPTDLNAVLQQTLALYRPPRDGIGVETSLATDLPPVAADRDLLARALGNLLANALEAMPAGGTLRVRTSAEPPHVAVRIEDTGPGLTEEQRTRLFTPYYTTKRGGTGLGLAIVQGIVSDHGGRVHVRSEPGRGTTFTLLLPMAS